MGFLCQRSCYLVPDAEFSKAKNDLKVTKKTARKQEAKEKAELEARSDTDSDAGLEPELAALKADLEDRRLRQFEGILEETRAWMYTLLIPTETIANGDANIKAKLDAANEQLREKLLGIKVEQSKIDAVCGKISRNILVSGVHNREAGRPSYPPVPLAEQRKHLLDPRYIKAEYLQTIYQGNPDFEVNHPQIRTWHEIRQVAGPYRVLGEPLTDVLDRWQEEMTWAQLGLPYPVDWSPQAEARIHASMQNPDPFYLGFYIKDQRDLILARSGSEPSLPTFQAELNHDNVMSLHGKFYEEYLPDSIKRVRLRPNEDNVRDIDTRILIILHEITHSKDVLNTRDHVFGYREHVIDFISAVHLHRVGSMQNKFKAYGLESCLALARRDKLLDTNFAEDNAESWALYFTFRILLLIYPELDILETLENPNRRAQPTRIPKEYKELLHHCTLLYPLRHWSAADYRITNAWEPQPWDYDPTKDHWSEQAHHSVKDILEIAKALDDRRIDGTEKALLLQPFIVIGEFFYHLTPAEASEVSTEERLSTENDCFQNDIEFLSIKLSTLSDERHALEQEADEALSEDNPCYITQIDILKRLLKALRTELNMIGTARGCLESVWDQAGGSIGEALELYQTQLTRDETAIQAASDERSVQLKEIMEEEDEVVMALFGDAGEQKPSRKRLPSLSSDEEVRHDVETIDEWSRLAIRES